MKRDSAEQSAITALGAIEPADEVADELMPEAAEFFAPVASDLVDGLLGQYASLRSKIDQVGAIMAGSELSGAVHYFLEGNRDRERHMPSVPALFEVKGAVAALNASFWSKTLALTDVLDCMPQKRRDEWNKSIHERTTPDFTEESVRPTLAGLLASRQSFFAERLDGIFRELSSDHVTNVPAGFSKRMIIADVLDYRGSVSHHRTGYINDLRCVVARFMGRDEPAWNQSSALVEALRRNWGEWVSVDGGALRVRLYRKGTAHLEVHPDMAYRLNQMLAHMHPSAIPAEFRTKPKRRAREFSLMRHPLPFAVLSLLNDGRIENGGAEGVVATVMYYPRDEHSKHVRAELARVLIAIGAAHQPAGYAMRFDFDFDPTKVLEEIVLSGCVPDHQSHQFYATPASVGEVAMDMARLEPHHRNLEPSAGLGDLALLMPAGRATCVEVSGLRCAVLRARGFADVHQADFIEWAATAARAGRSFDRVVMNPPFSEGRAAAHLVAASELLTEDGRITAILPASMRGKELLPGWDGEWSSVYAGEFTGTSVAVAVYSATKL